MKKLLFFFALVALTNISIAQSLDDIGKLIDSKKFAEAKAGIDKYVAAEKNANNADGFYYKGRIYNSLSREATTSKLDAYNYKITAFEAFKQNQALDKKDFRMSLEFYNSYLDLYLGFYDIGAQLFNDQNYTAAYNSFVKAQEVENYILAKKYNYTEYKVNALDTSLILNTGAAALQAKDTASGIIYYTKITDANLVSKDYEQVYQFLASYYRSKGDKTNMQTILEKGKKLYPESSYWSEIEMANLSEGSDKTAMFAKYEELYVKDPSNFTNTYNYAVELYNVLYNKDAKSLDIDKADKLTQILKSAIAVDKTDDANMLMTNHLYNYAADYSTKAALIKEGKLAKPADLLKKKQLNASANAKLDELIPYAENGIKYFEAQKELKTRGKINYQLVAGYLADAYRVKGNAVKSAQYQKLKDSIKF